MLARLARKYFQSHSPATYDDYFWWSGLTATECRRGMDALGTSPWEKELKTSLFMPVEEELTFGRQWKLFSQTKG